MKPKIDETRFGSIKVAGEKYEHDVVIRLSGEVEKRQKPTRGLLGTAHIVSLAEAEFVYEAGARWIIVGAGQSGMARLSPEAAAFFRDKKCAVMLLPTPEAMRFWNENEDAAIGLFHVTC